eukprot:2063402-Amphidinium_carterae.1
MKALRKELKGEKHTIEKRLFVKTLPLRSHIETRQYMEIASPRKWECSVLGQDCSQSHQCENT